mgnify:CR=1 FL=1
MNILKGFSIKKKLILIQLLTTFAVLSFYTVFNIVRDTRFYLNSVSRELTSIADLVGSSCISALHFYDRETAGSTLSILEADEHVVNALILDSNGELFAEYNKKGYNDFDPEKPLAETIRREAKFITISKPIFQDKETLGYISIRYDMRGFQQIISKNKVISLIIFLIGMATAWILAVFTQKTISNPILKLREDMKRISETGDYSIRPSKERDDEIGVVTDGICDMLEQIQVREEERARMLQALQESEEKYRNLVERANDGIVILQEGVFKYVNPSLVKMAGSSKEKLLGSPFIDFVYKDEIPKVRDHYLKRMKGEPVPAMYETVFKTGKGEIVDAEVNAGSIKYKGKPADLVIIRDITKRKQMERELIKHRDHLEELVEERTTELEEANERLLELDRLKSMFLASMSHELRTPLNSIIGFTGILLMEMSGELNPEQRKQLNMVKSSAHHLLDLINDILDISKIESGKVELSIETFSLMDVVREVLTTIQPLANEKNLQLSVKEAEEVQITSDRRRVKQILMNLVSNSVKFTDKGFIEINITPLKNHTVSADVKDTGIGIHKEKLKILFNPFQQIDMTSTKKYEGTGLGLYLSKKIVTHLHGDISVKSKPGKGSTFTFILPIKWKEEPENEKSTDH